MGRGGQRRGAGRPKGTGKFGEKTIPLRVPESLLDAVNELLEGEGYEVPLYSSKVAAGAPDAADSHVDRMINLASLMVRNPKDTFCVQIQGESMINAGINPDDIVVVDRKLEPRNGKIVVAAVNGELTVKRLKMQNSHVMLMPANDRYEPIVIGDDTDFHIWGVATNVIKAI